MTIHIGLILFPNLTQLDAMGPFEVFSRIPDATVHLIAHDLGTVTSDTGLRLLPTTTFEECPNLDVLCVPGGPGQTEVMEDALLLDFLRTQGAQARYVTSVCTGSLLLGAAGLLNGYKATSHWSCIDDLALFGAIPTYERVVQDRNRFTGGGVTAGIDFALTLVAELVAPEGAKLLQLALEYDPAPPFDVGSPHKAPDHLVNLLRTLRVNTWGRRHEVNMRVAKTL